MDLRTIDYLKSDGQRNHNDETDMRLAIRRNDKLKDEKKIVLKLEP